MARHVLTLFLRRDLRQLALAVSHTGQPACRRFKNNIRRCSCKAPPQVYSPLYPPGRGLLHVSRPHWRCRQRNNGQNGTRPKIRNFPRRCSLPSDILENYQSLFRSCTCQTVTIQTYQKSFCRRRRRAAPKWTLRQLSVPYVREQSTTCAPKRRVGLAHYGRNIIKCADTVIADFVVRLPRGL